MRKLKEHEQRVFDFIRDSLRQNGYPPSVRDIMSALGYKSTSTVHLYLHRLEELGYISMEEGKSRAITVPSFWMNTQVGVPILGKVTAGIPILAEENFDGYLDFSPNQSKYTAEDLFALKVCGKSMIGAGIFDGDYVIVERGDYAENGDIVVVMIEDEATVKTFYKEKGHFRLQPENPDFEPILVTDLTILGKVIAAVRYY